MPQKFNYTSFDLRGQLPESWQDQVRVAAADAEVRNFPRTPALSREATQVAYITRGRLHADQVKRQLPWLHKLYRGHILELAASTRGERVNPALDDRYGLVLNVQRGTSMRFECHVDSNPLTGLLFCTDQPEGSGGELVFAHDSTAVDVATVERDCSAIRPEAGLLIIFDGRKHPHYARRLRSEADLRIAAVMNFYTASCPEATRPPELNRHLYGDS